MEQKFQKIFWIFEVIAFEAVTGIFLNYDKNASDRQSTCYETLVRFHIWLRDMFSNVICLGLMESHHKSAVLQVSAVFGTSEHVHSRRMFWNRSFQALKEPHFLVSIICKLLKV